MSQNVLQVVSKELYCDDEPNKKSDLCKKLIRNDMSR